jgi:hypothetical protein
VETARRVADAQGVDDHDGHALAGFIEAEASFGIRPNNRGRSWVCHMALTQRDDDADMLVDIARVTGLGRLSRRPAQRKSRPQVGLEFAVWALAVVEWSESRYGAGGAATHRALRAHAEQLRELRRYVDRPDERIASSEGDDGLTAFFGGFFTGEGSFSLSGHAVACVHLRADDAHLLRTFQEHFDLGRMSISTPAGLNPSVKWTVGRRAELPRAIALLDAAVLRGRKRREFDAWRVGAAEYARGRDRDNAVVAAARAALQEARSYVERKIVLPAGVSGQDAFVPVLRALATEEPVGKLTATAYERARERHPDWPTRNTIAAAFGGWARALEAAGLGSRVTDRARSRARRV